MKSPNHRPRHPDMRIAYTMINCNRSDGSARALVEVAERLSMRHEVHLFARTVRDMDLSRIQWHRLPGPGWPEVADFTTFFAMASRAIARGNYDITHSIGCNAAGANVYTIQNIQPAKRKHLNRIAATEKISPARRLTRWLYLEATSRAERRAYTHRAQSPRTLFLPVSAGVATELRTHYAIGPASVEIIPNAADIHRFVPCPRGDVCSRRAGLGLPAEGLLFAFVGGEWARKGLDLAIQSIPRWSSRSARLVVLGDDPDRLRFEELARSIGVEAQVLFAGFTPRVEHWLSVCDAMVFPSWYEAFSLATIEAAACGLPLIATRINGTEDFVEPYETGLFCDHDPTSIANAVNTVIENPELREKMGAHARQKVEAFYTWDRVASMTEAAYFHHLSNPA